MALFGRKKHKQDAFQDELILLEILVVGLFNLGMICSGNQLAVKDSVKRNLRPNCMNHQMIILILKDLLIERIDQSERVGHLFFQI